MKEMFETMLSFIVLVFTIARVCSFPQNYGHEGNFGYDPFGGTFPQHLPALNPEYVPPVEYPPLPPPAEARYDSYVPMIDGKPIYIPEVYHDGFVFRDMTLSDPNGPVQPWQQDQEANLNPQSNLKAELPVKKVKPHHSKRKQRPYPKGNVGARSTHKKPVAHKNEYDDPVVVQSFSKMGKPVAHKPIYDYESIKKFLEEEHDFSKESGLPVLPKDIEKEVAIKVLKKKGKPVHKKPNKSIKYKPVAKPVYPEYEQSVLLDPLTKKEKPGTHKKPIKQKPAPVKPVYSEYEGHEPVVVYPLKKKPVAPQKPILHVKPVPGKKPVPQEYVEHDIKIVEVFTENENVVTDVMHDEEPGDESVDIDQETPIIEAFSNKKKHGDKPDHVVVKDDKYDSPLIVDAVSEKEKAVLNDDSEESADYLEDYDDPIVVDALTKKKPVTHEKVKPVNVAVKDDEYDKKTIVKVTKEKHPSLIKDKKPNHGTKEYADETPIVEALSKKEKPHVKHGHKKPAHPQKVKVQKEEYEEPVKVIVQTEKHHPQKKDGQYKHPDIVPLADEDDLEVDYEPVDEDEHVSDEMIAGKSIDHDDSEYDYDTPEVVEVLTKKEKPVSEVKYDDYDVPNVVEALKKKEKHPEKEKVPKEEEYDKPVKVIVEKEKHHPHEKEKHHPHEKEKHHPHEKDGHHKHPHPVHPLDKDDVEVDYEPVDEWSDEDKDYELGDELESRDFEGSDGDGLSKDVDTFDGSGSVSEGSDKLEGRNFLPVDPNVWSLVSHLHTQERRKFKSCLTPKNESGNCMPIQMCAVPNFASNIDELLNNVCVIDEVFIGICCPEFPVDTVKVQWDQFVEQNKSDSFNEEPVKECGKLPEVVEKTVAWPWMAPLVAASTGKVFCGGALINEQYVLSAAHCTKKIPHNRILVRLGSLDTDQPSDEDFEVVEIKRHAQYNPRNMANDIALLKLSRRAPLGDFRGLICLPEDDDDYVDETSILLGWKGFSEKMDDVETLNVISKENCQKKMGVIVADSVVCTHPRTEQIKCNDDSGAPLVIGKDKQFKIIGVLTWNRNDCDSRLPSIFTRVSEYRKWIQRHAV